MTDNEKPLPKKGFNRIWFAGVYSIYGLRHAFKNEAAFKQECIIIIILLPLLFFLPISPAMKMVLFICQITVLIVELLNSAVESIIDKVSPEYHPKAKQAKDMGSAAVMLSLLAATAAWLYAVLTIIL